MPTAESSSEVPSVNGLLTQNSQPLDEDAAYVQEVIRDWKLLAKALFPLWGTIVVLMITRITAIRDGLLAESPSGDIPLGNVGTFKISPALVVQLANIFNTDATWEHGQFFVDLFCCLLIADCCYSYHLYSFHSTFLHCGNGNIPHLQDPSKGQKGSVGSDFEATEKPHNCFIWCT